MAGASGMVGSVNPRSEAERTVAGLACVSSGLQDAPALLPVCKRMLFRTNIRPNYSAEYSAETDMPKVTGIRYSA